MKNVDNYQIQQQQQTFAGKEKLIVVTVVVGNVLKKIVLGMTNLELFAKFLKICDRSFLPLLNDSVSPFLNFFI